jgi:hypothetical protein
MKALTKPTRAKEAQERRKRRIEREKGRREYRDMEGTVKGEQAHERAKADDTNALAEN